MKTICLHIAFFVLFPYVLFASPITVRTGDHEGFTRVVLSIPQVKDWAVEVSERDVVVAVSDHDAGFDTSEVFDRIDKERVSKFVENPSTLEILMDCDCTVESYRTTRKLVVLDIFPNNDLASKGGKNNNLGLAHVGTNSLQLPSVPQTKSDGDLSATQEELPIAALPLRNEVESSPDITFSTENPESLKRAREILLQEFGSSATRGILVNSSTIPMKRTISPQIDLSVFSTDVAESEEESEAGNPNILISSSGDLLEALSTQRIMQSSTSCTDATLLEISQWGDGSLSVGDVGKLRSEIFDDLQQVKPDEVLRLARFYLYFGFGAEAAATLNIVPSYRETHPEMYLMAEVMEFSRSKNESLFKAMESCNSAAAMWSLVAGEISTVQSIEVNTDAVIMALNDLPVSVREHLAPIVGRQLLKLNLTSAADLALRTLERSKEHSEEAVVLARSSIDLAENPKIDTRKKLDSVVESNTIQSALALIELIDLAFEDGTEISEKQLLLASAYNTEFRQHDMFQEMQRVYIIALAISGKFSNSIELLEAYSENIAKNKPNLLQNKIFQYLVKKSDPEEFLLFAFDILENSRFELDDSTIYKISERLNSLGFFEQASSIESLSSSSKSRKKFEKENIPIQEQLNVPSSSNLVIEDQTNVPSKSGPNGVLKEVDEVLAKSAATRVSVSKYLED